MVMIRTDVVCYWRLMPMCRSDVSAVFTFLIRLIMICNEGCDIALWKVTGGDSRTHADILFSLTFEVLIGSNLVFG